ncbi:MAG: hypothetical protein JXR25_16180 [Pontiellaceae bacterium]|nr:hypothetical protein [Pontiellaceae bacterium]MBN2786359.1 hypothetical protein [Pontiellaceae bacterium]
MKNYIPQLVIGILLCCSSALLTQAAGRLDRMEKRQDATEQKLAGHCENFTIHLTKGD